jgi:hypothetical protein
MAFDKCGKNIDVADEWSMPWLLWGVIGIR